MKETIVIILQQRMDKCTSEQFWAVALLTGIHAFIISQRENLAATFPDWIIISVISIVTLYGIWFIIHRHISFYSLRDRMVEILKEEKDIPESLKKCPSKWRWPQLSGVLFYAGWSLIIWLGNLISLFTADSRF